MTQYRLLERNVDTINDTDEFWDEMKKQWSVVPDYLIGRPFLATIPYRRRVTKKIALKEYVERYGTSIRIEWRGESDEGFRHAGFIMPDESWPTGQEREIEIPA